jgi:hypothetical protein
MKTFGNDRMHEKIINRLERQERQEAFKRDRFFRFKLPEIHSKLSQVLLMERIIETDNPAAVSDLLMKSLKKVLKMSEFDFKYFIAPIRSIVPRPNPISLYITQFLLEVALNEPYVIEMYGTDEEIYRIVNNVVTQINMKFERAENEILKQLSSTKSLIPGSREYDIALDQLLRKRMGEPQK